MINGSILPYNNTRSYSIKSGEKEVSRDSLIKNGNVKDGMTISSSILAKSYNETLLTEMSSHSNFNKILGWIPYWNQNQAYASFQKHVGLFNHVGLFWYVLRSDGSVQKYPHALEDPNIIDFAHKNGVKVLAIVANLPAEDEGGDWDAERVDRVTKNPQARKNHVNDLVSLTVSKNFDGINIDYEALKASQKNDFTLFIKELATALHAKGKILGVSLHPKVGENNPEYSNGSEAQDWKSLSKYADQLYIMAYDEHWSTSPPGPLASLSWVEEVLSYAKTQIPNQKLFAGTTIDAFNWGGSSKAKGLTYTQVLALIKKYNPKIVWDPKSKTNYFSYRDGITSHTVWYEDNGSVSAKLNLFKNMGLVNIAFWPLGDEDQRVWITLRNSP